MNVIYQAARAIKNWLNWAWFSYTLWFLLAATNSFCIVWNIIQDHAFAASMSTAALASVAVMHPWSGERWKQDQVDGLVYCESRLPGPWNTVPAPLRWHVCIPWTRALHLGNSDDWVERCRCGASRHDGVIGGKGMWTGKNSRRDQKKEKNT